MGIGRRLISALCDEAFRQGHERVGLIVEPNNTKAQTLYSSVGFRCVGEREFFSHMMWHMQIEQNFSSDKFAK
jgi:ribosomal protein S18 acetylase RimI-like enzyme